MSPVVEFVGALYAPSGYGEAARLYLKALVSSGLSIRAVAFRRGEFDDEVVKDYPEIELIVRNGANGGKAQPPTVRIVHHNPAFARGVLVPDDFQAGPTILLTTWETDALPTLAVQSCNGYDAVWVATEWNREVFAHSGVQVPIEVFPHPHAPGRYQLPAGFNDDQDEKYTFYWIGAWQERKNPMGALRAYLYAFRPDDPVRLVLKTSGVSGIEGDIAAMMNAMWPDASSKPPAAIDALKAAHPQVIAINETWDRARVDTLHANGNCILALSRAEGWNLPLYEALLWGNQAIASDFGGHQWAREGGFASFVSTVFVPCFADPQSQLYTGKQCWAEPDLKNAASQMRALVHRRPRKRKGATDDFSAMSIKAVGAEMRAELEKGT